MSFQQCLPVPAAKRKRKHDGDAAVSFENVAEMTSSEYMAMVRRQAQSLPMTFMAPPAAAAATTVVASPSNQREPPIDGSAASIAYLLSPWSRMTLPLPHQVPTNDAWMRATLHNFRSLRDHLDACSVQGIGGKATDRIPLPPMKDERAWRMVCLGEQEASGNPFGYNGGERENPNEVMENDPDGCSDSKEVGRRIKEAETAGANTESDFGNNVGSDSKRAAYGKVEQVVSNGQGSATETTENENKNGVERVFAEEPSTEQDTEDILLDWSKNIPPAGREPSVQLVLQMDQVMIRSVLAHLAIDVVLSESHAAWLYALLARLERPVHRDDAARLYGMLKALTRMRSRIAAPVEESQQSTLARINLLIVVIGVYFGQGNAKELMPANAASNNE